MTTVMGHTPAADADAWALIEAEEGHRVSLVEYATANWRAECSCDWSSEMCQPDKSRPGWWKTAVPWRKADAARREHLAQATSGALVRGEGL